MSKTKPKPLTPQEQLIELMKSLDVHEVNWLFSVLTLRGILAKYQSKD